MVVKFGPKVKLEKEARFISLFRVEIAKRLNVNSHVCNAWLINIRSSITMNLVELHLQNHLYHIQPRAGVAVRLIRVTTGFTLSMGFTRGYSR